MSSHIKSLMIALVLCISCSLLLTAASTGLKSFQQRNVILDKQKNVLKAFNLISDAQIPPSDQIEALYQEKIQNLYVDDNGRTLSSDKEPANRMPVYLHMENKEIQAYAVPVDTRGLWGEINGYLAIEKDGATIRGFSVYQHAETPGLGGEIESRWFRKNFQGKKITDLTGNFVSIGIAKGTVKDAIPEAKQPNYVDGISGATLTGKFLSAGLKEILEGYEPVAIQFRHDNPRYLRVN